MENGLRCSGSIPYGYKFQEGDNQKLCVDEESAEVVRRIFKMAASGITVQDIADTLREAKVPIPSAYWEQKEMVSRNHSYHDPYLWTKTTVIYILERREYLGETVLGKTVCDNFKTKKRRNARPEELLVFPDTHESIIDQETWELANKLRKRTPKKVADGTYSHRLSGVIFCADCGARMGYKSPESKHRPDGRTYDSDSGFQCGNYRSIYNECTSHFVKTSSLEAAILKAIQAAAENILEDEEGFARQLMEQWESTQQEVSAKDRKELAEARKRVGELDTLIRGLYENQIKGILPERQARRLMEQYDTEQAILEERITELETAVQEENSGKPDISRFIALIKKHKDVSELTDVMIHELVDKVEVHAATGGRTRYRQQQIDVHLSFIGCYQPPGPVISEEERRAAIDAAAMERYAAKTKRAHDAFKLKKADLKEAARTDPEAAREYEELLERRRQAVRKHRMKKKAEREADPEYQAKKAQKERQHELKTMMIAELEELAKTQPDAAEMLNKRRGESAEMNRQNKQRREERISQDQEYADKIKEKQKEHNRKRQQKMADLREQAKTDPAAAEKLAEIRAKQNEATKRSYRKKREQEKVDAEAAAQRRGEQDRRNQRQREQRAELKARAETDSEAAAILAAQRARNVENTMKSRRNLRERAKTDPEAAAKVEAQRQHKNEYFRKQKADLIARAETDPEAAAELERRRERAVEAVTRSNERLKEAAKTDPEAAAKLEAKKAYQKAYNKQYREAQKEKRLLEEEKSDLAV